MADYIPVEVPEPTPLRVCTMVFNSDCHCLFNLDVIARYLPLDTEELIGIEFQDFKRGLKPLRKRSKKQPKYFQNQATIFVRIPDPEGGAGTGQSSMSGLRRFPVAPGPYPTDPEELPTITYPKRSAEANERGASDVASDGASDGVSDGGGEGIDALGPMSPRYVEGHRFVDLKLFRNGKIVVVCCISSEQAQTALDILQSRLHTMTGGEWSVPIPNSIADYFQPSTLRKSRTAAPTDPRLIHHDNWERGIKAIEKHRKILMRVATELGLSVQFSLLEQIESYPEGYVPPTTGRRNRAPTQKERLRVLSQQLTALPESVQQQFLKLYLGWNLLKIYLTIDDFKDSLPKLEQALLHPSPMIRSILEEIQRVLTVPEDEERGAFHFESIPAFNQMPELSEPSIQLINSNYTNGFKMHPQKLLHILNCYEDLEVRPGDSGSVKSMNCTYRTTTDMPPGEFNQVHIIIYYLSGKTNITSKVSFRQCVEAYQFITRLVQRHFQELLYPELYQEELRRTLGRMPKLLVSEGRVWVQSSLLPEL